MNLCKCGCKKEVSRKGNIYIRGHYFKNKKFTSEHKNNIAKSNLGHKHTEETKAKIGKRHKGRISTFKGRKHTEQSKKKMSESTKGQISWSKGKTGVFSDETLKKMSESHKGITTWNKGLHHSEETKLKISIRHTGREISKEHRDKISKANKGLKRTKETREKMSKSNAKRYLNGFFNSNQYKSGHYYSKKNDKELWYRSSYELVAYEMLEQLSKVKRYETEPFAIQYEWENYKHNTIPDILVTYTDNSKELIEIKPKYMLEDEQTVLKLKAMKEHAKGNGMDFSVWTEKDLNLSSN